MPTISFADANRPTRQIPLTQGLVATVDAADYAFLMRWSWCANYSNGRTYTPYAVHNGKNRKTGAGINMQMHRLLMGVHRQRSRGIGIDHINGDGLDNRRCNLRRATDTQNGANAQKRRTYAGKPTTSRYKGVTWNKRDRAWRAQLGSGRLRSQTYLGNFTTELDAARAYNAAAIMRFGSFARLNVIDMPTANAA